MIVLKVKCGVVGVHCELGMEKCIALDLSNIFQSILFGILNVLLGIPLLIGKNQTAEAVSWPLL